MVNKEYTSYFRNILFYGNKNRDSVWLVLSLFSYLFYIWKSSSAYAYCHCICAISFENKNKWKKVIWTIDCLILKKHCEGRGKRWNKMNKSGLTCKIVLQSRCVNKENERMCKYKSFLTLRNRVYSQKES